MADPTPSLSFFQNQRDKSSFALLAVDRKILQ